MRRTTCLAVLLLAAGAAPVMGAEPVRDTTESWLDLGRMLAVDDSASAADADVAPGDATSDAPDEKKGEGEEHHACKGPPIPFHSIEGYSGGAITPMAYICNWCQCGCGGKDHRPPSVSYSWMNIGTKNLHTIAVTQSWLGRFEFGYAINRLSVGSLRDDIQKATGISIRKAVYLHHFNFRANILPENSFDLPLPAITFGVHFKYNQGVENIDRKLGGALSSIGYKRNWGVDYTLTASKMFPKLAFGRPLILTGGLRFTKAAQMGLLGFGSECRMFFEGSVVCMPTDWLVLGYEFRQKDSPYDQFSAVPGLVGKEDNWHAFSASWIVNKRLTISALYGLTGNVVNAWCDTTLGLQVKYEF